MTCKFSKILSKNRSKFYQINTDFVIAGAKLAPKNNSLNDFRDLKYNFFKKTAENFVDKPNREMN